MPYFRLLGAQLAIGAAAIFARFALAGAGPFAVSALRLGIATVAVLVLGRFVRPLSMRREIAFACAGFALAVHFATWIASLQYTSVAISTLLVTTTPIWTEAVDAVRERRAPAASLAGAFVCALAGVALIASAGGVQLAPIPGYTIFGDGLALLGSVAIGAYLLIVRDAGNDGAAARLPTRDIVLRTYAWATVALAVAAILAKQGPPALGNTGAWAGILAMALVSQLLGHTALNAALRTFTPSIVAMSTLLEPPIAACLAALVFHETLSLQALFGAFLVLVSVGAVLRDTKPPDGAAITATPP